MTDSDPPPKEEGSLWRSDRHEAEEQVQAEPGEGEADAASEPVTPPPPEEGYLQEHLIQRRSAAAPPPPEGAPHPEANSDEAAKGAPEGTPEGSREDPPEDAREYPAEGRRDGSAEDSVGDLPWQEAASTPQPTQAAAQAPSGSQHEATSADPTPALDPDANRTLAAHITGTAAATAAVAASPKAGRATAPEAPPAPAPVDDIIRLQAVRKAFNGHVVLDGVDIALQRHKVTTIIGPSGTGKSVLLKHIVGLIEPDAGEVYFEDRPIHRLSPRELVQVRMQIGFLFQMGALFDSLTVLDNITFPLVEHTRMPAAQRRRRGRDALALVGMAGFDERMPGDLSGGQRKRVALARAIVLEPKVVLYDEPTTGLDPIRAGLINELIATLNESLGITSVVVTHDMASAQRVADRIIMLYDGRIIADAQPRRFMSLEHDLVQRFIKGEAEEEELAAIRRRGPASEGRPAAAAIPEH